MKNLLLVLSLALVTVVRAIPAGAAAIGFTTSQAQFAAGDNITIREVLSTSSGLNVGDSILVRGSYQLQSQTAASLAIQLTALAGTPSGALPQPSNSHLTIASGSGTFELEYLIQQTGSVHVTFYGLDGNSFGGIYFAASGGAVPTNPTTPTNTTTPVPTTVTPAAPNFAPAINTAGVSLVPFTTSHAQFAPGDSITIREVHSTSPQMQPGDVVVVRGDYQLQSQASASLLATMTDNSPGYRELIASNSQTTVQAGSGSFELAYEITQPGALHVSLYPAGGGSVFGGIYYASPSAPGANSTAPTVNNPVANTGRFANLSIRSLVSTGEGTLIAGLVVTDQERYVLIRGVGPTLAGFGVSNTLKKPTLSVYNSSGQLVASAGSWSSNFSTTQQTGINMVANAVGAFPLRAGSDDAVLNLRLVPGAYTVNVTTGDGQPGVALLEVYASPTFTLP